MNEAVRRVTLTELATDILLFAVGMRDRAPAAQFCCVHQGALKLFDEFESRAKAERIDPDEIAAVKYALAAFVDEVIMRAEWSGRDEWAEDPLQLHYFGTYLAGEGFFENLGLLRSQAKTRSEALAVYYQCLLLGLKGKYGVGGEDKLESLMRAVQNELGGETDPAASQLCPHWQAADKPEPPTDKIPRWFVYACVAVVVTCVLLYAFFFFNLASREGNPQQGSMTARTITETSGGASR